MNKGMEFDSMQVMVMVRDAPLKGDGITMEKEAVEAQAHAAREALRDVNPEAPGTCVDERRRVGVLSGEAKIEPRHSAPGGPNVYGLYIAELTGYFGDSDTTGEDRLGIVTKAINEAGIRSGGHKACAANKFFNDILGSIAGENAEAGRGYTQERLGDDFDDALYSKVVENAQAVVDSGRYNDWSEDILLRVLGDEAGEAIEILEGDHEGKTVARTKVPGKTVDQNVLHDIAGGGGSFVNDDAYEDRIDSALADGPNAAYMQKLALHAREALIAALVPALPNEELHGFDLKI